MQVLRASEKILARRFFLGGGWQGAGAKVDLIKLSMTVMLKLAT